MRISRHALMIAVASALSAFTANADVNWNNATGGVWQTGSNWAGGFFPEGNQVARFSLNKTVPYTVTFNANTSVGGVTVNSDRVNFDLSGRSLNLTNAGTSLIVGDVPSKVTSAILTVSGGSILASGNAVIGNNTNSNGTLNITGLGTVASFNEFDIGSSGTGLMSLSQQSVVNAGTVKTSLLAGSTGTINVGTGSQLHIAGLLQIGERGIGALNITGGGQVDADYMLTAINPDHTSGQVQANITVDGAGSSLTLVHQLVLGVAAPANMAVTNGRKPFPPAARADFKLAGAISVREH